MTILEAVAKADRPMRASDLVAACKLPRATVHRICGLLGERGYLRQQIGASGYVLGPKLVDLANLVLANQTHNALRHAVLESVAQEIGETCNIAIPDGARMVYWDRVETKWPLRHQLSIGAHVPLHCTANGKLYLSTLSEAQRQRVLDNIKLEKLTPNTITNPTELELALAKISRSGVSTDNEEFLEGMIAIAVPITDAVGRFVAGLAIHAPVVRLGLEDALGHVDVLRAAARELGSDITESSWDVSEANRH
jgi:DNA-binding IclR family transcriptional regulator